MTDADIGLGIDIGGSGIKGAPVDLATGELTAERVKYPTPRPATPEAVAQTVARLVGDVAALAPAGCPVGVTFPAVVRHGVAQTAANVDSSWIGADVRRVLGEAVGREVFVVNDADASAVAEHRFGAARGEDGTVLVTTLGTGIGTALLVGGRLVPNTELGHVEVDGTDAEKLAAASAKDREGLTYEEWARRLQRYYSTVVALVWPDLIVVGGGVSRDSASFLPLLDLPCPIVPAELRNTAGIVGAAALARDGG
jgi:polyphosphate glucokinase